VETALAMNDNRDDAGAEMVGMDLAAAREGSVEAFERLYREYAGRVFALCLRMTGDRAAAEERTQDTFVKAWEKLPSFRGESLFSTWLHRLAVNEVLMEARSGGRRAAHLVPVEESERAPVQAVGRDPGAAMDLEKALRALPEGARQAFVLHDVYGYDHGEIARMAGYSTGTSKAQLHRARALLKETLR
jgi:RNA polymerase sigma-70 factor (ECF subfamily)